MSYQFIRIDKSLVVPATSIFSDDGETVYVGCPGFTEPLPCGGAIADGIRMFLEGTRTFRVTPNGVLDLYGGLKDGIEAQRAFNTVDESIDKLTDVILDAQNYQAVPIPSLLQPVQGLNIDAIARGIKSRK